MARYARVLSKSQVYHVMLRGNNRQKIFIDEDDKKKIIDILQTIKANNACHIYAFCVMDNHMHLIIKEGYDSLSRLIKRIAVSYAYYFNKKYKRVGHVFQDRYRSENIEDDRYLLSAIRYIHQNPMKAGVSTCEEYCWSSYQDYISENASIADVKSILPIFSEDNSRATVEFVFFHRETTDFSLIDLTDEREVDEKTVMQIINTYLKGRDLSLESLKTSDNRQTTHELIRLLLEETNLSKRKIAQILGLNREYVRKLAMPGEPSP